MSTKRYTDEFKIEAVRKIVEYGRPVVEVAERLGVSIHSLYGWKRQLGKRTPTSLHIDKHRTSYRLQLF